MKIDKHEFAARLLPALIARLPTAFNPTEADARHCLTAVAAWTKLLQDHQGRQGFDIEFTG